ncbi:thiol-disulfide oxidoreductase DCC family protein [Alteromonas flava]|uniref:thiol-disulfide oxidoreductase DCC family protein n=1 Tax=Alteromonas flava TaxID=2048003 RepID=UPI000C29445B|nr:DUF393 domain-containing protein [Alteromonas flava]
MQFTLFYDGNCPLCMKEMRHLMQRNQSGKLVFEDINQPDFAQRFPELDYATLDARIHGRWSDGKILTGLDVTYTAWKLVGHGWLYAPLRWPLIRPLADRFYLWFARHRHTLSYWLTGQKRCDTGQCALPNKENPNEQ